MIPSLVLLTVVSAPTRLVIGTSLGDTRHNRAQSAVQEIMRATAGIEVRRLSRAIVIDVVDGKKARLALRRQPGVRWVEEDVRIQVRYRAVPNDPLYPDAWHLHATSGIATDVPIDIEPAWDLSRGLGPDSSPARVAVLDDGFATTHPDLQERFLLPGQNLSNGTPYDAAIEPGTGDNHGTQTAGVIAATGDNLIGGVGVCPACAIVPVRLIGGGGPTGLFEIDSSTAADAIEYAVEQGQADVINNSWGPPDGNPLDPSAPRETWRIPTVLAEALAHALESGRGGLGTVVTWAAGNGGELVTYDGYASFPGVLAVGAVDASGRQAPYSDYGPSLFLCAPSGGASGQPRIHTTDRPGAPGTSPDDYTSTYNGTSAAAAIVAGSAALVIAAYPNLTGAQVMEALAQSAVHVDHGYDESGHSPAYGFGRVNPTGALLLAGAYDNACTHGFELCNNRRDDDCDGSVDEDCASCIPDAGFELCDGHDNNCDGQVDEDFVCETTNRPSCAPCKAFSECDAQSSCASVPGLNGTHCFARCDAGEPCPDGYSCNGTLCALTITATVHDCHDALLCHYPERCDGKDNDCNGVVDDLVPTTSEGLVAAQGCLGQGVCADPAASCFHGAWTCSAPAYFEPVEVSCDGRDNDCDGQADEPAICAADREGCSCQGGQGDPILVALVLAVCRYRRARCG